MNPAAPAANSGSERPVTDVPAGTISPTAAFVQQDYTGMELCDFRLLRRLGVGGMGQVYLAEQLSLQRRVALKLLRPDFATHETWLRRFQIEAKAVARLTHPNIVQVHAVGEANGLQYMALEYVEGTNLKEYVQRKGPPEPAVAISILRQIALALLQAAELGIIHRDIKPENILITRKAEVKVTDFGLSRMMGEELHLTQTGTTMGTPLYMSPEQILGKAVDPRSDLYSLGATAFYLLSGQPPFQAETAMAVGMKHLSEAPPPLESLRPDLPLALCQLINRLLAKRPEERPASAREVLRELRVLQEAASGTGSEGLSGQEAWDVDETPAVTVAGSADATVKTWMSWRARKWPWLGISVAAAIVSGCLLGWWLRTGSLGTSSSLRSSSTGTGSVEGGKKSPQNAAFAELERALIQKVQDTAPAPDAPGERVGQGLRARAELMRLYVLDVNEANTAKANRFAEQEIRSPLEAYRAIGYVGKAGILANEGRHQASYEALEQAFQIKPAAPRRKQPTFQLLRNKDIQDIVNVTFHLNQRRLPIPASLKEIREELDRFMAPPPRKLP